MRKKIKVWHMEITDANKIPGAHDSPKRPYELKKLNHNLPEFHRFLYLAVGAKWCWYMRLAWSYQQWLEFLSHSDISTWVAYLDGTPIGYFELKNQRDGNVEIAYFGLIDEFIGRGYGRNLLEDAIRTAWTKGGKRVSLHTCTLDHPQALTNYLARGFKVFKEEEFEDNIPDEKIQPWPQAQKN